MTAAAIRIAPLAEAVAKLDRRTPIGAALSSREWANAPLALRERAQFSAHVESARFMAAVQRRLMQAAGMVRERVARGEAFTDRSSFIGDMKRLAEAWGVRTPGAKGGIRDIRSARRLGLIFDMQTRSAHAYARWKMGQDERVLDAWPAQELVRLESRRVPRDWRERWAAAGGRFTPGGRMIALKNDPIWGSVSRFGTPWPPFDFGSGMGVRDLDRAEAEAAGVLPPGRKVAPIEKDFNEELQAGVKSLPQDVIGWLKSVFGDQVQELGWELKWQGSVVGDFYRDVLAGRRKKGHVRLGIATPKAIAEAAKHGIDLRGKELRLDATHAIHIHKTHGPGYEKDPSQIPVTALDVELLPHVWRDPDDVEPSHGGGLKFWKNLLGRTRMVEIPNPPSDDSVQVASALVKKREQ